MATLNNNPRGNQAVGVSSAFTALATLTVLLRLYTRFSLVKCAGLEDYFITLAMLCSIGLTVCIGVQAANGMGQHIKTLGDNEMRQSLKAFWASLIVYYLSLGLTKTSILLQYRRVFATTSRTFHLAFWAVMAVVVCYTIWTEMVSIFACVPVRAFWTKETGAKCINQFATWFTNAAINILTDFALIILPIPVIRNLNLARRQKQALIGIFAVGGLVCIVSIMRLHSLVRISNSADPTYDNPSPATWSSVETNIGIICSCLPCLRPLIVRLVPGVFSSKQYMQSASRTNAFSRSTRRRSAFPVDTAIPLESKISHRSSNEEGHGADEEEKDTRIRVQTEVHISFDDDNDLNDKESTVKRADSCESLIIQDPAKAV
ncbi:hypothetical protein DPSP01_001148 [Paraphaeosphaeria sporulosa]